MVLIRLLREELRKGGWTSNYLDDEMDTDIDPDPMGDGLGVIVKLLGVGFDAIGVAGWLVGTEEAAFASEPTIKSETNFKSEGSPESLLSALRDDIEQVVGAVHDAITMKQSLGEVVRYASSLRSAPETTHYGKRFVEIPLTLQQRETRALPLGSKAETPVSKERIGLGGEVRQRSRREIGQLKSMQVAEYSVEKIRV
jgi:hypothetical protein